VETLLGDELRSGWSNRLGYLLSRGAFQRFRSRVDYSEYGGATLLGVAGLTIVGHGRSSAKAIENAIGLAARFAAASFTARVSQEIGAMAVTRKPA
jgi:glycerol-3-phosphate acyltransferase PlsX